MAPVEEEGVSRIKTKRLPLAFWIFIGLVVAENGPKILNDLVMVLLVAGIDRIFDMGRTTVSITGDAA